MGRRLAWDWLSATPVRAGTSPCGLWLGVGTLVAVHEGGQARALWRGPVTPPDVRVATWPGCSPPAPPGHCRFHRPGGRARQASWAGGGGGVGTLVISAIAGTAGVGKTAVAVHLAHQLDRFLRALGVPTKLLP